MSDRTYISVILPLKLGWEPCYFSTDSSIQAGQRVKVMFAGKEYTGVVSATGIEPQTAPAKIKEIISMEMGLEPVSMQEMELWRMVAGYYMCSIGEVYKAAYPVQKISGEMTEARKTEREGKKAEREKEGLRKKCGRLRERIAAREENLAKKHSETVTARLKEEIAKLSEELAGLEDYLSAAAELSAKKSQKTVLFPEKDAISLSPAQEKAYKGIHDAFAKGKPVLLNGVTGSGKTEIYISLAIETLKKGGNVLYLVPEIAVSRQLEERLQAVFGDFLLTFHSAETAAHRRETAAAIRKGVPYIVLGTRSAVFLPHRNLGLIIVDEEHDTSYKQDSPAPRYNGRDTAIMLSGIMRSGGNTCNVILGSGTPSLESIYNCRCGRFIEVRITERYYRSQDADIEIIDTNAERRKRGMTGTFSRKLVDRIEETVGSGGQVMLLRTRRSFSPVMQCADCGYIPKCPHCNVSLSYHKDRERMKCHYCGYSVNMSMETSRDGEKFHNCPKCGGRLKGLGAGTQKIEEEAATLFPNARIARLDSDNAQSRKVETDIIKAFAKGDIDILIGTQIVAKGFDFSNLSLVAVLQADTLLGMQDFRADEKAVQILEQFRGRCGRRGQKSLFVIQTAQPEHPIYQQFLNGGHQVESYTETLLSERRDFSYPPYTRTINIIVKDRFEDRAERMSGKLHTVLSGISGSHTGISFSALYMPSVSKVADEHIRIIRASLNKDKSLSCNKKAISEAISSFESAEHYAGHISIDVDPI